MRPTKTSIINEILKYQKDELGKLYRARIKTLERYLERLKRKYG